MSRFWKIAGNCFPVAAGSAKIPAGMKAVYKLPQKKNPALRQAGPVVTHFKAVKEKPRRTAGDAGHGLFGSPKQIEWARSLRRKAKDAGVDTSVLTIMDACFWIENRDDASDPYRMLCHAAIYRGQPLPPPPVAPAAVPVAKAAPAPAGRAERPNQLAYDIAYGRVSTPGNQSQ